MDECLMQYIEIVLTFLSITAVRYVAVTFYSSI